MTFDQIAILISSCSAIFFLKSKVRSFQRIGFIVGILGQPFWLWAAYEKGQYGIFLASVWYTINYGIGIYNFYVRKA